MLSISKRIICFAVLFAGILTVAISQQVLPYKNPALPVEERVNDLLGRMTPEEKFWQCFMIPGEVKPGQEEQYRHGIFGFQVSAAGATAGASQQMLQYNANEGARELVQKINRIQRYFIEQSRLGIPIIAFDEGLHGLVRGGATSFPQSIGLAATWDTTTLAGVAQSIALESKVRGIRQILSPVINLANDVRWGRVEETYGEDPYLSAVMGVSYMGAFERMGIVTTPKHLLANVGEGGRDSYPIHWSEWYLRQTHLLPFEWAFKKAGTRSVMTSYNSVNGEPSTSHDWILKTWLKNELGFKGFIISDASATGGANVLHMTAKDYPESSEQAMNGGLDVIFQTDYDHYKLFMPPFLDGRINAARLDEAVSSVLRVKFELGLFENPYINENDAATLVDVAKHKALAREAAAKSIVLLRNDGALPLPASLRKLAVIGEEATLARLGGYSGPGNGKVSILDGLKASLAPTAQVSYHAGYNRKHKDFTIVPGSALSHTIHGKKEQGLLGEYFDNMELQGSPVFSRSDAYINFQWTLFSPDEKLPRDFYAVRWTGILTPQKTETIELGLEGNDGFRLYVDDKLHVDRWAKNSFSTATRSLALQAGKAVRLRIEFKEPVGNATVKLIWNSRLPAQAARLRQEALKVAQQSDAVVVVAGIHEGEFQDRALLNLPADEEALIEAMATSGKPVTVVLIGGSAITMQKWLGKVQAVVMAWYPGEEGGHAVADVLTGKVNPAGRLPITFPIHEAQLPLSYWHLPTGRGNDYHNLSAEPLFPFGYGMSYTQFAYSNLQISPAQISKNDTAYITCTITNTGKIAGDEVVQLYLNDEFASLARPVMELKGFERVSLKPGESRQVRMTIAPELLRMWNGDMQFVTEPGRFRVMVGASSKDIRLKGWLEVK